VPAGDLTAIVPLLKVSHDVRMSRDKDFKYLLEDIAEFNSQRKTEQISLNEAERRKERDAQDAREKLRDKDKKASKGAGNAALQDDGLQPNERNIVADLAIEKARKSTKDVFLNEAVHILSDEVGLLKTNARLAASVLPKTDVH
jgi:carboxyl-terminal processing protease